MQLNYLLYYPLYAINKMLFVKISGEKYLLKRPKLFVFVGTTAGNKQNTLFACLSVIIYVPVNIFSHVGMGSLS